MFPKGSRSDLFHPLFQGGSPRSGGGIHSPDNLGHRTTQNAYGRQEQSAHPTEVMNPARVSLPVSSAPFFAETLNEALWERHPAANPPDAIYLAATGATRKSPTPAFATSGVLRPWPNQMWRKLTYMRLESMASNGTANSGESNMNTGAQIPAMANTKPTTKPFMEIAWTACP